MVDIVEKFRVAPYVTDCSSPVSRKPLCANVTFRCNGAARPPQVRGVLESIRDCSRTVTRLLCGSGSAGRRHVNKGRMCNLSPRIVRRRPRPHVGRRVGGRCRWGGGFGTLAPPPGTGTQEPGSADGEAAALRPRPAGRPGVCPGARRPAPWRRCGVIQRHSSLRGQIRGENGRQP